MNRALQPDLLFFTASAPVASVPRFASLIIAALVCCPPTWAATPATGVVATVNGQAIGEPELQVAMNAILSTTQPSRRSDIDDAQQRAREQLILDLAAAQAATGLGLENDPVVKGVLAYQRAQTLHKAYLQEMLRREPVTEAQVEQEYARGLERGRAREYHVAHIVVAQRNRIDEVLSALKRGEDFSTLAKLYSQDGSAVSNGGDLGWMRLDSLQEFRFVDAVKALKSGAYTAEPVQGATGWHIVKLLDAPRALDSTVAYAELPDATRKKLRARATQRRIDEIEKHLVAEAKITRAERPIFASPDPGAPSPAGASGNAPSTSRPAP